MISTRKKGDILPVLGKTPTEISAYTASAKDCNFHELLQLL
jgi:hypothetical protein